MRLRSHKGSRFLVVRGLCALACAGLIGPVLTGCGGGSGSTNTTRTGPIVSPAALGGGAGNNQTFTVTSAVAPQTGSIVTIRVEITNSAGLNTTTNPPRLDILGPGGVSLINGPQPLQSLNSDPNGFVYQYNITGGTLAQQYSFVVYAQDTSGNKGNTPFILATQTLP